MGLPFIERPANTTTRSNPSRCPRWSPTGHSFRGKFSPGCTNPGHSVWHWLSTQFNLQICAPDHPDLHVLPRDIIQSQGHAYAGIGKIILTTEVKLKLNGKMLKLSAIEEDLNNGSGFAFPIPSNWRTFTGTQTSTHSGQISTCWVGIRMI